MKTNVTINDEYDNNLILEDLETGDWFKYYRPDGSEVIAIKGDDRVSSGRKFICMRVRPWCGVLARLNHDTNIIKIQKINISLR